MWGKADMVMKVKEPISSEYGYFRKGLVLFTYLHLAAEPKLAKALVDSGVTAIAYETVEVNRTLPLLTPMSEVAGRMASQIGAQFLEKSKGGKGILSFFNSWRYCLYWLFSSCSSASDKGDWG